MTRPDVRHRSVLLAAAVIALAAWAPWTTAQPPDDPDEAEEQRIVARRALQENCLICHGEEMMSSQRLTAKQWKAEVEKMVGWGSPLPVEFHAALADYLTAEYPATAAKSPLTFEPLSILLDEVRPEAGALGVGSGDVARGEPVYAKNCANCHGNDGQGAELGPNLREKPVLARPGDFFEVVRKGRGRMPGFAPLLDPAAEADMLAWLRSRPFQQRVK